MRPFNHRLFYASAILLSSSLMFLLQPMMAKVILPSFGGSAGVWTACMLFFQVLLLAGYLYAHCITRYLSARSQAAAHMALLAASVAMLPVNPSGGWKFSSGAAPAFSILGLLATSIGLPYFVLSTTSPLMQAWYARETETHFPYRLFALSNLASLAALLAYPLSIEPLLSSRNQLGLWSAAYLIFVLLAGFLALRSQSRSARPVPVPALSVSEGAPVSRPLLWLSLAACASSLWLAVANHLSQEVAAIPFLWVLPLSLYLLSFILCFDRAGWYRPRVYRWILPAAWITMGLRLAFPSSIAGFKWEFVLFSAALFVCCMFCHGELARLKPDPRHGLTLFYLSIAAGGALGAVFVAMVAPQIFTSYLELPIAVAASVILGQALLYGRTSPRYLARLALVAALAFIAATRFSSAAGSLLRLRNFYGALRVVDSGTGSIAVRALYNGTILHGLQFQSPSQSRFPTTYYGPQSGAGLAIASHRTAKQRVGVIGLGVGTLAAYGRAGDYFRFYEINPAVVHVASTYFHFLSESPAQTEVVTADGRLGLEREQPQNFDVLILDAFSGDSIPVHLLTRQAFESYFRHLRPGGLIAIHVTNRYLDLPPVVEALAGALQKEVLLIHNEKDPAQGIYAADWSLVADSREALRDFEWRSSPKTMTRRARPWTDDYSNLFQIVK
jgi:SAM-dependent methyltransferase